MKTPLLLAALSIASKPATPPPDEVLLGRPAGYPVAPRMAQIHDPRYVVGSFSALDTLACQVVR